jgi:hypothetical protein
VIKADISVLAIELTTVGMKLLQDYVSYACDSWRSLWRQSTLKDSRRRAPSAISVSAPA